MIEDASLHMGAAAYLKNRDMELHLLLAEASGNPVPAILKKSHIKIQIEVAYNFLAHSFERELFQIHKNIFHSIAQKKVSEVKKLIKADILFVKKNLKKFLERGNE